MRDAFGSASGTRQRGTVEYQTEVSSYDILTWTSFEVVTVRMGQPVSVIQGCDSVNHVRPAWMRALSLMASQ